jgi:aminopeptidase
MSCETKIATTDANQPLDFPPFDLEKLLGTVFDPEPGLRIALLIDLEDLSLMRDMAFLKSPGHPIQTNAIEYFYRPLHESLLEKMDLLGGHLYAYQRTCGSNLELPATCVNELGETVQFSEGVYTKYDIILCLSTDSATAPLTAHAKSYGFRGATLHGINQIILESGLCVDYHKVSRQAELLRIGMTRADRVEIDFQLHGRSATLTLELGGQEAQKSHGLCLGPEPDVANLPAGEVYFVPTSAQGEFPRTLRDGTLAMLKVEDGADQDADLIGGEQASLDSYLKLVRSDPAAGRIGELGFGTQNLPRAGVDIQDEKILGTVHVATGRSDHLGGDIKLGSFRNAQNATHEDILFDPVKTPQIAVPQVRMVRDGQCHVLLENYQPAAYIRSLLEEK